MDQNVLSRSFKRYRRLHEQAARKRRKATPSIGPPPSARKRKGVLSLDSQFAKYRKGVREAQAGMPKRKFGVSTKTGRRSFKRSRFGRSRKSSAVMRLKLGGLRGRSVKFRSRFRGGRRLIKGKVYPAWFKQLIRGLPPSQVIGEFGTQLAGNPVPSATNPYLNLAAVYTFWKHLSLWDIQVALDSNLNNTTANSNSGTAPAANAMRQYITDLRRKHTWRSALQGGEQELQFYQLIPRRDLPAFIGTGNNIASPQISPSVTGDYKTGGVLPSPNMWTQPFSDENAAVTLGGGYAAHKISAAQNAITPFMNPILTSNFKIRPLRVNGPNGKASVHRLQPGQECTFEGTFKGPHMVSWNKYLGQGGSANLNIQQTWEIRRGMPLIFLIVRGSVAHDSNNGATVITSPTSVDYYQMNKFVQYSPNPIKATTIYTTTGIPNVGAAAMAEEVDIVTAQDTVVVAH